MNIGVKVLQAIFPKQEEQRRELRHAILHAEACVEDLRRTIRTIPAAKNKLNGAFAKK